MIQEKWSGTHRQASLGGIKLFICDSLKDIGESLRVDVYCTGYSVQSHSLTVYLHKTATPLK
jgi:hypothetical protein